MTEIYSLFSGSSGNCSLFRTEHHAILIDAGRTMKKIDASLKSVDLSLDRIDAIFASHEHSDHVSALTAIVKHFDMPVYLPGASVSALSDSNLSRHKNVRAIPQDYSPLRFGDITVSFFRTPHDSASSVGFIINTPDGKYGLATDMGTVMRSVAEQLTGCKAAIIESNYDHVMLENGSYPRVLKNRIGSASGHLDNRDCARLVAYLAMTGTEKFMLAHLSKENNTPEKALACVKNYLVQNRISADVKVAQRDYITRFI